MMQSPLYLTEADARQKGALGREPVPDARYLLAPISMPAPPDKSNNFYSLEGFDGLSRLSAVVKPPSEQAAFTREDAEFAWAVWGAWEAKNAVGSPGILMQIKNEREKADDAWTLLAYDKKALGFRLDWQLGSILSGSVLETARELTQFVNEAARRVASRRWTLSLNQSVEDAARHAEQLIAIKQKFSRSVAVGLFPHNRPFFCQSVWRTAYALGMQWTDFDYPDRFIWPSRQEDQTLFAVSEGEVYGALTLESAVRNKTVSGLTFWYELPTSPAPLETFDRMALALNYFAQTLGGRPITATGDELDGDRLEALRDELVATVSEMARLGLAPGSPEAARFF